MEGGGSRVRARRVLAMQSSVASTFHRARVGPSGAIDCADALSGAKPQPAQARTHQGPMKRAAEITARESHGPELSYQHGINRGG